MERCQFELFEQRTVRNLATGEALLELRALHVAAVAPGYLVMATSPQCKRDDGSTAWCGDVLAEVRPTLDQASREPKYLEGTTNIFIVDVRSGAAEFIASATYHPNVFISPTMNWPLAANQHYVAWTESYCGEPRRKTRIFDRRTREIRELDVSEWVRFHGDVLGFGDFASHALLEPDSLEYRAALPVGRPRVAWSPDLRYAVAAPVPGHGGLCG